MHMLSNEKATNDLFVMIENNPDEFMDNIKIEKFTDYVTLFTEYFYDLLRKQNLTLAQLVYKVPLSQSYLYQVAAGKRCLGRDAAIIIALAMKLNLEQTQDFLKTSKNAVLYPKVKRDALIICCIECGKTLEQTDEILLDNYEKGLTD